MYGMVILLYCTQKYVVLTAFSRDCAVSIEMHDLYFAVRHEATESNM